jgi:hypothetical protein
MNATYNDTYFGPTAMHIVPVRTVRNRVRVLRYRWEPLPTERGCITTGMPSYSSEAMAIAAARRHARFVIS